MYINTGERKQEVIKYNEAIKELHNRCNSLLCSDKHKITSKVYKIKKYGVIKLIKNRIELTVNPIQRDKVILDSKYKKKSTSNNKNRRKTNYFNENRIAVYTCITGGYDTLCEPLVKPDNIDYYAITDFEIDSNSLWKRIDINEVVDSDLSNVLKNRYVKMNPHYIFKDYNYSIYIDGNIKIYTDFTEHVNRIGSYPFAHFKHSFRNSSYEEADACKLLRKDSYESIDNYINKLKENNFPDNYGLLECSIIVRKHSDKMCQKIYEQWWEEFKNNVKRDQIIFPYILFKNKIAVNDVATLGDDIENDLSFEIIKHKKNGLSDEE